MTLSPKRLAGLPPDVPDVFVSINPHRAPRDIIANRFFVHPALARPTDVSTRRLAQLQGTGNTWFAGGWMRVPHVHEQALSTGLEVGHEIVAALTGHSRSGVRPRYRRRSVRGYLDALRDSPIFASLDPCLLDEVRITARPFDAPAGEVLDARGRAVGRRDPAQRRRGGGHPRRARRHPGRPRLADRRDVGARRWAVPAHLRRAHLGLRLVLRSRGDRAAPARDLAGRVRVPRPDRAHRDPRDARARRAAVGRDHAGGRPRVDRGPRDRPRHRHARAARAVRAGAAALAAVGVPLRHGRGARRRAGQPVPDRDPGPDRDHRRRRHAAGRGAPRRSGRRARRPRRRPPAVLVRDLRHHDRRGDRRRPLPRAALRRQRARRGPRAAHPRLPRRAATGRCSTRCSATTR